MEFTDRNEPLMLEGLENPFSSIDEAFAVLDTMTEEELKESEESIFGQDLQYPQNPI